MKPEQINDLFKQAYDTHDMERMLALYEDDAVLDFGPAGIVRGKEAIKKAIEPFMALRGNISYERRFCVVSGDLALVSITFTMKGGKAPDGSPVEMRGSTVELVRRQADGTWLYVIDLPLGATPAP